MDNPPHRQGIPSSGLAGLSSFRQAPALSSSGSSAEPNTATLPPSSGLAGFHSLRRAQAPSPISATVEHRLPSAELASPPGQAWHPPPSSGHAGHRPPDATVGFPSAGHINIRGRSPLLVGRRPYILTTGTQPFDEHVALRRACSILTGT
ncbi:hypothetical protein Dimus_007686 [Dionaea muscipula]